jgi:hypothetical protein
MSDKGTKKKLTRVESGEGKRAHGRPAFTPTAESKGKAKSFRIFALLSFLVAIGLEVFAILQLNADPIKMWLIIALIVADMVFAIVGSVLWKKANRFDPASERDKFRFFVQNQLGAILSVIAFLPLVILILTNKDLKGKEKGILGAVAGVAMLIAVLSGVDFNPPSAEEYAEQTSRVEELTGKNFVYWTEHGTVYHIYSDCRYINTDRTDEIFEGTVAQARELKNITDLCSVCETRAEEEFDVELGDEEEPTE